jgi:hypothetical protein
MALFQTEAAKGREPAPIGFAHGVTVTAVTKYTFGAAFVAAADKVEMMVLPANAKVVSLRLIGRNLGGANNASVGIMSGEPGDPDNARTVGTQFLSAQAAQNAEPTATSAACLGVAAAEGHRSIGVTLSADVAAGDRDLTLLVQYTYV